MLTKVICRYDGMQGAIGRRLTIGKIYDIMDFTDSGMITIRDNIGDVGSYFMLSENDVWFEDATSIIRDKKINEILNG